MEGRVPLTVMDIRPSIDCRLYDAKETYVTYLLSVKSDFPQMIRIGYTVSL